jgi:hypothetical protein
MSAHPGACHCGAIGVLFETDAAPERLQVRSCQCGFCRRHGARTVSDPEGRLTLSFDPSAVHLYRFGTGSADFLVCRECGAYVASVMDDVAVVNTVGADLTAFAGRTPDPVRYDGETLEAKRARRKAKWTPVTLEGAA